MTSAIFGGMGCHSEFKSGQVLSDRSGYNYFDLTVLRSVPSISRSSQDLSEVGGIDGASPYLSLHDNLNPQPLMGETSSGCEGDPLATLAAVRRVVP